MLITLSDIHEAADRVKDVVNKTPLQLSKRLSHTYGASIYLKREDLQDVRSYKIRGAYNMIASLSEKERKKGIVTASAGNHAQGVAYSCAALHIKGTIFMPAITPLQKINKVRQFGKNYVSIELIGATFDDASRAAQVYCTEKKAVYIPPFDHKLIIAGQATIGSEIVNDLRNVPDMLLAPIGGGGLISGLARYFALTNQKTEIIGVEPLGAASMQAAYEAKKPVELATVDTFIDGAAVKKVGDVTYNICSRLVRTLFAVPEGKVCAEMIDLYQNEGIIAEPAGALSVAALDSVAANIKGKTVVCVISGGNNDILRYPEIMERSLVYQGKKHYFILEFAQKPGQLRQFLDKALGKHDDIVRFEYMKKTNKEKGGALVGIELQNKNDLAALLVRMDAIGLQYKYLTADDPLYSYVI